VVVGVTNEPESLVKKSVEKARMKFPIARVKTPEEQAYGIRGFPSSFLIDVDGTILWKGHPGNFERQFTTKRLEQALARTSVMPSPPEKYARALDKHVAKSDFAKAYGAAAKSLSTDPENEQLKMFTESIEGMVASRVAAAEKAEEEGAYGRAFNLYSEVAAKFDGVPGAEDAKGNADGLKRLKEAKDDLAASKKWDEAMKTWRKGDFEKALKGVATIAKKYGHTPTGEQAEEMLDRHSD
jgi:hypothetical protein